MVLEVKFETITTHCVGTLPGENCNSIVLETVLVKLQNIKGAPKSVGCVFMATHPIAVGIF